MLPRSSTGREKRGTLCFSVAVVLLLGSFALPGCGQMLVPPTPTAVPVAAGIVPTVTHTPRPTATRRATFTPVPATPSDTPTPTITPTPIIYVIQKGDTLIPIARKFGVTVQEIQDANGISDPRRLSVGQEIIIPVGEGPSAPTIVPTPTPIAFAIRGIGFHRTPVDSLWCMGEIVNMSGKPAEEVQVEVSLHDTDGRLLASGSALAALDIIPSGGHSPFAVLFAAAPSSFAQYQTRVLAGVPSTHLGPRYPHLSLVDDWGGWLDGAESGNYQVRGAVQNTGPADAQRVAVVVTLYDIEDHVVAARTVQIAADIFIAGARAPFEVTLVPVGDVARYDIAVQGWWIGYEIPLPTGTAGAVP
ncbi:MAG: LysM peptidoglycan-binding domain-containing protein [Anaerolineae bacterium]|nr:LysM peptidoglycan-binding domain-containing protein [Anaerolineae bacterium]